MKTMEDRFNEQLNEKDKQIAELQARNDELEVAVVELAELLGGAE